MTSANLTPSPDEIPAVDTAETADGHPHTLGVEYTDDEVLVGEGPGSPDMAAFGEEPDVETHVDEQPDGEPADGGQHQAPSPDL